MNTSEAAGGNETDTMAARFAHLVAQQSSMALMLLGKAPHPETGQTMQDLDAAGFFIDQLEMLEVKTKGNLSAEEAAMLKQSLMSLRMAYVESTSAPAPSQAAAQAGETRPGAARDAEAKHEAALSTPPSENETHKKFSKKY